MGKYNNFSSSDISEYIFADWISGRDLSSISNVEKMLPILVDNGIAYDITGIAYMASGTALNCITVRMACKLLIKCNKDFKKSRRALLPFEYGGSKNCPADAPEELVKLSRCIFNKGTYMVQSDESDYIVLKLDNAPDDEYELKYSLYFIGEHARKSWNKFKNKVDDIFNKYEQSAYYENIRYMDPIRPYATEVKFKSFDDLVMHDKESIIKYIDNFIDNIPRYHEHGIIPKLSFMLYGEPGTGKSTFAQALAKYLGVRTIASMPPSSFNSNLINQNGGHSNNFDAIYTIDDIDCVCSSREGLSGEEKASNNSVLSSLLSFLDNPPSFEYTARDGKQYKISVIVATTNYYDKLDDAVKRYGRFDKKIEMEEFGKELAQEMCDLYGLNLNDIVNNCNKKGFKISPAKLQALCLENIDLSIKSKTKED